MFNPLDFSNTDHKSAALSSPSMLTSSWTDVKQWFGIGGTTADTSNMTPAQAKAAASATTLQHAGMLMTIMGGVNSALGSYFAAKSQQYTYKSQALNLEYEADMAHINARSAEYSAQSMLEAGKSEIANVTMRAGQEKASTTATMAAHGIRLGQGSAQEISASQDIVKDINVYTISANAARAAAQSRVQSTSFENEALMDRTSADNARRSASAISPFSAVTSSLLTSASAVAGNWNNSQRLKAMMAQGYMPGGGVTP